ncbi:MAG TPA: signal peptide peptidase SppA [Pirellulales bacterium]|nr:signal peptide peptidase SppA [Pirellulales bacterium]
MDSQTPQSLPTATYVSPQIVVEPPAVGPSRRRGGAGRWFARLVVFCGLGLVALVFLGLFRLGGVLGSSADDGLHEQYHSLARAGTHKVAIITVEGTILGGDGFVKHQIDRVRSDQSVKAIVLRVNSPGGTVTGSDYLYHHLDKLVRERNLPLVVSMGGIAASGGYYVAMAAGDGQDVIFAEPTTWTGSIGVVIPHYNVAGLMEHFQVEEDSIKSHPLKQMGSPTRRLTEEERRIFQELVDDSFHRFKEIVKAGRPYFREHEDELDKAATGQVFTTRQALENHLIDREGFIEDALDRALVLASLDKETTQVVKYKHFGGLLDTLLGVQLLGGHARNDRTDLEMLLELTSPRAYYLCTWLPAIETSLRPTH